MARKTYDQDPQRGDALELSEETLKDFAREIENLGHDKRLAIVIAAFAAGYVLGRGR